MQCSFAAALTKQHAGALLESLFTSELTIPYWLLHLINTSYMLVDRQKEEDGGGQVKKVGETLGNFSRFKANALFCLFVFFFSKYPSVSVDMPVFLHSCLSFSIS